LKTSSRVSEARSPIFRSLRPTANPGVPFSTRKQLMPRLPLAGLVETNTTKRSAIPPLLTQHLAPLIENSSPAATAEVTMEPASLPAPGSDKL
jgi:hypothetical protein